MENESLARKYRPQKLDEIIGQEVVVQSLKNAIQNKSLHHAYIFCGSFGLGKTTLARILAAMENDPQGPTIKPDPNSTVCSKIFSGKSSDVKELDAASQGSVDNIRALHEEIQKAPIECRTKYVILDESHRLSGAAAEAALKMIEEPPPHVRFILCTTDPHLLKDTIHSRCITFKLSKIHWSDIYHHLKMVADKEGLEYEEEALRVAAKSSKGSARNSLQNLQNLINFTGEGLITADATRQALGTIGEQLFFDFFDAILNADVPEAMKSINNVVSEGRQSDEIINSLHYHLRNLMISMTYRGDFQNLDLTEEEVKKYQHQANQMGLELILTMMDRVIDISRGITFNLDLQMLLENYIINTMVDKRKIDAKNKNK